MTHPAAAPDSLPPSVALLQMTVGTWVSQIIYVAAKLGIADLVVAEPKTSEELARATGTHAPSLHRVLRALAGLGVLTQDPDDRFGLTPLGSCLRSDVPDSVRGWAVLMGEPYHRQTWTAILHSVRTGEPAFDHLFGTGAFEFFAQHPEIGAVFQDAMTATARGLNQALLDAYDFASFGTLVDVGGGRGTLLAMILGAYPALRGVVFDLPHVVAAADAELTAMGVADRCAAVGGDFFATVPEGGDAYLLKNVIHDWGDAEAVTILRHCRAVTPQDGRLLLYEAVLPPSDAPSLGKLIDVEMLLMTHSGRERTESEFRALLAAAGYRLTRVVPTQSPLSVVEGIPA